MCSTFFAFRTKSRCAVSRKKEPGLRVQKKEPGLRVLHVRRVLERKKEGDWNYIIGRGGRRLLPPTQKKEHDNTDGSLAEGGSQPWAAETKRAASGQTRKDHRERPIRSQGQNRPAKMADREAKKLFWALSEGAERMFSFLCTKHVIGRLPQREPPSQRPSSQSRVARMCASLDSPERGGDRGKR